MCGIGGLVGRVVRPKDREALVRLSSAMTMRGPDGEGAWHDEMGVSFVHRRLSVIDLSPAGAQPMIDPVTGNALVYNGEIYNFAELRAECEMAGDRFDSNSDTEVLLALYRRHGPDFIARLRGMFAFVLWDAKEGRALVARDPFGIKPLYTAEAGGRLVFASQVKALAASGLVPLDPDPAGHAGFFTWGSLPEPHTLYRAIRAFPAGHFGFYRPGDSLRAQPYFTLREEALTARSSARPVTPGEARERLTEVMHSTLDAHFVSDVPVGVFLSGGLDSAMMLGLAFERGQSKVNAVTLGYREYAGTAMDETAPASVTARHFGARHTIETLTQEDYLVSREHLFAAMDQPTIDGVNTFFVSRASRRSGMKVMLSGLGGDELFGGYSDFTRLPAWHRRLRHLARIPGADAIWRSTMRIAGLAKRSPKSMLLLSHANSLERLYLLSRSLADTTTVMALLDPAFATEGLAELNIDAALAATTAGVSDDKTRLSLLNSRWYMGNQLLRDSDWAGMAHSVEIRVPLVDVVLWREVLALRYGGQDLSKADMVSTLAHPLPLAIVNRPKTGFAIPVREWLGADDNSLLPWARQVYSASLETDNFRTAA